MRKRTSYLFIAFAMVSMLLCGCKESIDLKDIDPRLETKLGLAMPIGTMKFTMNDLLGNNEVQQLYFNKDGILSFRDTFSIQRSFHDIDLAKYISETTKNFDVYGVMSKWYIPKDNKIVVSVGQGEQPRPFRMTFPLKLTLSGMNKPDIKDERVDSATISLAKFTSTIKCKDFNLDWRNVDSVQIVLGREFTRKEGNLLTVYNRDKAFPKQINNWGDSIPIEVDDFSICLMKDRKAHDKGFTFAQYNQNVIDTCHFDFIFYFTIGSGQTVTFYQNAQYEYNFKVKFMDYEAIWGYFEPSNKMKDSDTIDIAKEWKEWSYFKTATLPFKHPKVNIFINTQVAGAMQMIGEYLFVKNSTTQEIKYATFDQAESVKQRVAKYPEIGYLDVAKSKPGDSIIHNIQFSENWREGHIDKLFYVKPDLLGYSFHVEFDKDLTPQARINKGGTDIKMDAVAELPFSFNDGLNIDYKDTVKNVNISSFTLDSLLAEAKILDTVKTSNLFLVLTSANSLPMRIKGVPKFLDAEGKEVKDPSDPSRPIRFSDNDTLLFNAPTKYESTSAGLHIEPGISTYIMTIDKKHFDQFATIKNIQLQTFADNSTMIKGVEAPIKKESYLQVKIGIAANVDAIINLEKSNK